MKLYGIRSKSHFHGKNTWLYLCVGNISLRRSIHVEYIKTQVGEFNGNVSIFSSKKRLTYGASNLYLASKSIVTRTIKQMNNVEHFINVDDNFVHAETTHDCLKKLEIFEMEINIKEVQ